jgi:hypothetical protein
VTCNSQMLRLCSRMYPYARVRSGCFAGGATFHRILLRTVKASLGLAIPWHFVKRINLLTL